MTVALKKAVQYWVQVFAICISNFLVMMLMNDFKGMPVASLM